MAKQIKSYDEFRAQLESNPVLQDEFKKDPVSAANQFQQESPLSTDKWIYRIIVLALGLTILAIIIGVLFLMGSGKITDDKGVPTILTAIGSAAIGALAGLLAPPPKSN
jgi:hypothetical protein